jgi:DNA transformation protein
MIDLEDAVNIGPVLAAELRQAGIATLEELRALGELEAWLRVRRVNPERDCASSLQALAGAIRGVRWHVLPPELRRELAKRARAERRRDQPAHNC